MKRLNYLNVIRLISFAAIIYYHLVIELAARDMIGPGTETLYCNSNMHIATSAVALFFMISGASLMLSSRKEKEFRIGQFYKKRVLRILIPYYVASFLTFMVLYHGQIPLTIQKWKLIFNLMAMDGYATVLGMNVMYLIVGEWFMGCLVILYVLFPLLRALVVRFPAATFIAATAGYIVLALWDPFPVPPHQNVIFKGYEFLLGMYLITLTDRISPKIMIAAAAVIALFLLYPVPLPVHPTFAITITSVCIFVLMAKLEPVFAKGKAFCTACSVCCKYSYEIFLIHHFVIVVIIDRVWNAFGITAGLPVLVIMIIASAVLLGIGIHYASAGLIRLGGFIFSGYKRITGYKRQ